jgi:hypothetical protein
MKKLTRDRVVPIISASISWLTLAMTGSGLPYLAKIREDKKHPSQTLFARIEQLIDQIGLNSDVACQKVRHNLSENCGSSRNSRIMAALSMRVIKDSVIAIAVAMRLV